MNSKKKKPRKKRGRPDGRSHLHKQGKPWEQDSLGFLPAILQLAGIIAAFLCLPSNLLLFFLWWWVGRQEEVSGPEKMGRKGNEIICYSKSHIIDVCCFLSSARPLPSLPWFAFPACLRQSPKSAAASSCCKGVRAALRTWTAWFMNSKKRILLEPTLGSQRPGQKNSWQISFHAGQVLSALLDVWVIFCCFMMKMLQMHLKGVTSIEPDTTQNFVKVIALGHMFMYWPVSLLPLWWKCIMQGTRKNTIYHKPSYTSPEFVLLPQTTMQQMLRQTLQNTPSSHPCSA